MTGEGEYKTKKFDLTRLKGISEKTLEVHLRLYEGYVKETNRLNNEISQFLKDGRVDQDEMPAYSELKRRLGFEYNGMVLHELYFSSLRKDGGGEPGRDSPFLNAVKTSFGSYQLWKTDFVSVGKMRGIGWAICYQEPTTGRLSNHWISEHQVGNVANFTPVLVLDVWEHAYLLDYKPAERPRYIEAFFSNIVWESVDERIGRTDRALAQAP